MVPTYVTKASSNCNVIEKTVFLNWAFVSKTFKNGTVPKVSYSKKKKKIFSYQKDNFSHFRTQKQIKGNT
jgi:hypothetical protein